MNDVKESDAVKVYYDGKLNLLLAPNFAFSKQKIFENITNSDDFYKLYTGLSTKQLMIIHGVYVLTMPPHFFLTQKI